MFAIYGKDRRPNTGRRVPGFIANDRGFIKKNANIINGNFDNINYRGNIINNGIAETQIIPKPLIV